MSKTKMKVANVDSSAEAREYLARKMRPTGEEQLKSPTQKLTINISGVNSEGKSIKQHIGSFHLIGTDLYSETIKFRPLSIQHKLIKMIKGKSKDGADVWNYINQTIFFTNYGDTIYDEKGGIACGKVFGEEKKALSPAQIEANNAKAKSYMYVFGLVKFPQDGEWHLVDFRVGGKRIIAISDALRTLDKTHFMSEYIFDMTCVPSSTVHPNLDVVVDHEAGLQDISKEIIEDDTKIANYIEEHNERIIKKFKKYSTQSGAVEEDSLDEITIGDDE